MDEAAKTGNLSIRIGLGWAKSHVFSTGQCPVLRYHRQLMQAILYDKIQVAKAVNVTLISLDQAPRRWRDHEIDKDDVREEADGTISMRLFNWPGGKLVRYDPQRDEVVLLEQFRIGALDAPGGPWLVEIVAGVIDSGDYTQSIQAMQVHKPAFDAIVRASRDAGVALDIVGPIKNLIDRQIADGRAGEGFERLTEELAGHRE